MTFPCNLSACLLQGSVVKLKGVGIRRAVWGVNSPRADARAAGQSHPVRQAQLPEGFAECWSRMGRLHLVWFLIGLIGFVVV